MDIRIDYEPLGYEDGAPYHTVQEDFWDSEAFSPAFLAARGAGKTMAGAAKNLKNMLLHGSNSLVVGPRYESQVRAVLVPTYLEVIPKELLFQPYHETHKSLLLCDLHALARNKREPGQTIWFRSGDEPETVEGFTVGTVHLDESARMDKAVYGLALGCLRDPKGPGQIITTTTPPFGKLHWVNEKWGNGHWETMPDGKRGRRIINPNPECPAWNMIWTENYKLPEYWRKNIEEENDPTTPFGRQQLLGEVVELAGLVFDSFNPVKHIKAGSGQFQRVAGGIDRALGGMTAIALVGKTESGRVESFREWGKRGALLEDVLLVGREMQRTYPGLVFHADPSPGGEAELRSLQANGLKVVFAHKEMDFGVKLIQQYLKVRADGSPGFTVWPDCPYQIAQFQSWAYVEGSIGGEITYDKVQRLGKDYLDAVRYATVGLLASPYNIFDMPSIKWTVRGKSVGVG